MEIDLEAVRVVFCDVLGGRMTREAADRWAWGVMQLSEAGSLTFSPVNAKDRIWEGVMYLYGIYTHGSTRCDYGERTWTGLKN